LDQCPIKEAVHAKTDKPKQCDFVFKTWGGVRKGAGRKPVGERAGVSHRARPRIDVNLPAHVTLKMK